MESITSAVLVFSVLILLIAFGTWIFAAMLITSMFALLMLLGFPVDRVGAIAKAVLWKSANSWVLSAIPMFILMGELVLQTDIAQRLFRSLEPLVRRVPGRLLHSNVVGCTLMAAVSGSSTATAAMIGNINTRELKERNYDMSLSAGSLAGAGTLGLMIPPSIMMIIYGVLAEQSIITMFIAGVIPGLIIAALYSGYIMLCCAFNPSRAPISTARTMFRRKDVLKGLMPICFLMLLVLGGIYSGIVTPSEAGALGVFGTLLITWVAGQLSWPRLMSSLLAATKTSCMITLIIVCAGLLSSSFSFLHIPADIATAIANLSLAPFALIAMLAIFYVILGMFLDGVSITVMTLPITLPLVQLAGFDPVWFGVFLIIMIEMGLITPPVGLNLFVLQGVTGEDLMTIARAAFPFFLLMILAAVLITVFPSLALWLPSVL